MNNCVKCGVPVHSGSGKDCKLCQKPCCFEHLIYDNHDCEKTRYVKFIRKKWLRKKGQNISFGRYIVVCDECRYRSNNETSPIGTNIENLIGLAIEVAGSELENHVMTKGCPKEKVFLEQINEDELDKVRGMYPTDDKPKEYRRI